MSVNNTGTLDFSWSAIDEADSYFVKFYKNESYTFFAQTAETGYQVSNLTEGDTVSGDLYYFSNNQISIESTPLSQQQFPVFNFNSIDKPLSFSGCLINGNNINFDLDQNAFIASGNYELEGPIVEITVSNPRTDDLINYFTEEPFLTGVRYRSIDNLNDSTPFTHVDSFEFQTENPMVNRNFITQVVLDDFYNSSITGNIYLYNQPISVQSLSVRNTYADDVLTNEFSVTCNRSFEKLEYFYYDNPNFTGTPLLTGYSDSSPMSVTSFPINTTGYYKIIPYDWFGSGSAFYGSNYIYFELVDYNPITYNVLDNPQVLPDSTFGFFEISSKYSGLNNSGSLIYFSVDSGNSNSFSPDSLLTGELTSSSGYSFNYEPHLNSELFNTSSSINYQTFFVNFKLIQSGSHYVEDTESLEYNAHLPFITESNVNLDYNAGVSTLNFDTEPHYTYTGIDVLISGQGDSSYELYSGVNKDTTSTGYHFDVKLVKHSNHNLIFDSNTLSGSVQLPKLLLGDSSFSQSDSSFHFQLDRDTNYSPITLIKAYGHYSFFDNSTGQEFLGAEIDPLKYFNDYQNYFLDNVNLGVNLLQAPAGIEVNQEYISTGIFPTGYKDLFESGSFFSGSYTSGSYFVYRFLPFNGYGSGYATDPILANFPQNANTQQQNEQLNTLNEELSTLQDNFVKLHADTVSIPSGNCYINVDYSVAGFLGSPQVVGTLSTSNQEDPILGLIVSGSPTTESATFVLSDAVDSTGYYLKYFAAEQ